MKATTTTTMTADQVRLLGGPERFASIQRRIADEGTAAIMAAGHTTYAGSAVSDPDDDLDENSPAPQLVKAAARHLAAFLAAPDADDAADRLGFASALVATALSRCARTAVSRRGR